MGHSSCHFPRRRLGSWTCAASSLVCCASTLTRVGAERSKPTTRESRLRNPLGLGANVVVSPGSGGTGGGQTSNTAAGGQDASQPFGRAGPGSLTLQPGPQPSPWAVWGAVSPAGAAQRWSICPWPVWDCPRARRHRSDPMSQCTIWLCFSPASGCAGGPVAVPRWKCHRRSCLGMFIPSYCVTRCQIRWSL